jgi:hypothetical protein
VGRVKALWADNGSGNSALTTSLWIMQERNPIFASLKNLPQKGCQPKNSAIIKCHQKIPAMTKMPIKKP